MCVAPIQPFLQKVYKVSACLVSSADTFFISVVTIPVAPVAAGITKHFTFHTRFNFNTQVCIIIIIIVIIITLVLTFMDGIYNYTPETGHVSRLCSVAAVLYSRSVLRVML